MNGFLNINWTNVKSAIVYGLLTLGISFLLSTVESVIKAGSIFGINWHNVIDVSTMAVLPLFVSGLSLLKNLLTTSRGNFLGIVSVIPDKTY